MAKKEDLTVVVTGASAGLGRAVAQEFAKIGARVGLLSRDQSALDATAVEVEQLGGTAAAYAADVSDEHAVECIRARFLYQGTTLAGAALAPQNPWASFVCVKTG